VESALFGHERGAFTGATQLQKGVFEAADGGTVFLDEIGELPAPAQAALLRVLETRRVTRVGSSREIEVDVRLVTASHRDLEAMCASGGFRLDLLYRLNAMTLEIPPLRDRPEDIAPLALRFLEQASAANGRLLRGIRPGALELLCRHPWPGNVRELRNALERAVVIAEGEWIEEEDLPERLRGGAPPVEVVVAPTEPPREPVAAPATAEDLKARVRRYEAELLEAALREAGWNQTEAARRMGMPLRTLVHKLKALGITRPRDAAPGRS
jgi:DNA-binding NtrC family response regulator